MYTRVESQFWKDEKMQNTSDDARYLMLYILTSPHRNILGLYFLPSPYACFDLRWDEQRFKKGLQELLDTDRIKYDSKVHVVLISNYLKHNPLENPNQVKSAIDKLNELPKTPLFRDFTTILQQFDKPFMEPLKQRLNELLSKPGSVTVTESVTGTVTGTKENATTDNAGEFEKNPLIEIQKALQKAGILTPSHYQIECLLKWHDEGMELNAIILAIKKAALSNNPRVNYIEGTLRGWANQGITTLAQAEVADQEFQQRKSKGSPPRAPTEQQLQPRKRTEIELEMDSLIAEIEAEGG